MFTRFAALGAAALALAASTALAAPPAPRITVDRVAKAIETNYFDRAKAKAIARDLRASAAKGEFDRLKDPRDLAQVLSTRLSPLDNHFNVSYQAEAGPVAGPAPAPPRLSYGDQLRRSAYGFRRVEMLPGAIGYIDIRGHAGFEFGKPEDPARRAADAALQLVSSGDAVIIDLRDNGGGSPAMVGYLVSAFTPKDADIYNVFHGADGRTVSERPAETYATPRTDTPLYILVSARTGSAAEATAYTLQAAKRAVIVGESTAGAANPGGDVSVGDGFSIFVSNATPINAVTKANWEAVGVKPDVAVPAAEALARAQILALEAVLAKRPNAPEAVDNRWALEALKVEANPPAGIGGLDELAGTYGELAVTRQGSTLILQRGRRPASTLVPLGDSTFFVKGEPSRRATFQRDASGKVVAVELLFSSGQSARFTR